MEWEKKIANSTSDKGLVSKIYKAVIEFNIKIIPNYLIKKWKDDLNRHFSKENIHMASRYMKRCPMSLLIRELQIKTTTSYYLTPVRMAVTKKKKKKKTNLEIASVGEGMEKTDPLGTVGGSVNWYSHYGKEYGGSSKN